MVNSQKYKGILSRNLVFKKPIRLHIYANMLADKKNGYKILKNSPMVNSQKYEGILSRNLVFKKPIRLHICPNKMAG